MSYYLGLHRPTSELHHQTMIPTPSLSQSHCYCMTLPSYSGWSTHTHTHNYITCEHHWHSALTCIGLVISMVWVSLSATATTTITVLRPFVRDYPGEPAPEETFTHPPSWSSSKLYQLLPSTMIHSILHVQITCVAIFLHNLSPCSFWSTSWSGALHLIFHTFLHPVSVFFRNTCSYHRNLVFLSTLYLELYLLP